MSYGNLIKTNPNIINYNNQNLALYTSKDIPISSRTLSEPINNKDAINSYIKGGNRIKKNKSKYYMTTKNKRHRLKSSNNSYYLTKKRLNKKKGFLHKKKMSRRRKIKGGYGQYMNNTPNTHSYGLGGIQSSNFNSALANPPLQTLLPLCTNCIDNYNHFMKMGFPSKNN